MRIPRFPSLRLALLATLVGAAPALAGPPWISIEYPANPFDAGTRGALLTLHTYHHGNPMDATVTARAEGMMDGARRSVSLTARRTDRVGVWAITGALPKGSAWVVSCTMGDPASGPRATALLALAADGRVAALEVPVTTTRDGWVTPREATAAEISALLGATVAANAARTRTGSAAPVGRGALLAGVGLVSAALLPLARRRRRPSR